jgi:hypothetical protein
VHFKALAGRATLAGFVVLAASMSWPMTAGAKVASRWPASVTSGPKSAAAAPGPAVGPVSNVSQACKGQNAEVETAIDPANGNLYEEWIGCGGIGFARSTNGGRTFSRAVRLPGSAGAWDPAITVGRHGKVYAAFMRSRGTKTYPVVDISSNGGKSFPAVRPLVPPHQHNWGDRDFIAVSPSGTIYVTWDYGPKNDIKFVCSNTGSCSFTAGDVNAVIQRSTNGGKSWSKITPISPGFPASGADSAPVLVEPDGRIDVLYQGYTVVNHKTLKLGVAHSFFTSSTDRGRTWWRHPVQLGPSALSMNTSEWWIDGSLGLDSAGNLYATWDTQSGAFDAGWLAYSTTHGRTWSRLFPVAQAGNHAAHIVQVVGGRPGVAYVGWLTDATRCGRVACYAQFLRAFSIGQGWLTRKILVSPNRGNWRVWPGDTIGLSLYPGGTPGIQRVEVSWGSGLGGRGANSQIWAAVAGGLP